MNSTVSPASEGQPFSSEQKEFLQGFFAGLRLPLPQGGSDAGQPGAAAAATSEPSVHGTPLSEVCREERWKHDENPLDGWERLVRHADAGQIPDAENLYRFKTFGLFYVAPAQDSFMMRLRLPAGEITSVQLRGLAAMADELAGGYSHITTRANLQLREIKPSHLVRCLTRVQDLGLTSRGAGADNIRNVTASPDSGFSPDELLDVRPFAKALHHYILNHRDMYGLPRKFNVAFDNGGTLCTAADTNDIGFYAYRVTTGSAAHVAGPAPEPGIYFRVFLGGITGHLDFARDTGLLVRPSEAVAVSAALIRTFAEMGDRTQRKKARLKYVLDRIGIDAFVEVASKKLAFPLVRFPVEGCEPRRPMHKHGWIGPARQKQAGLFSVGVGLPVGRMSSRQMRAFADLADSYGQGELRLTVWQSLIIPHVSEAFVAPLCRAAQRGGGFTESNGLSAGVIACTGSRGCKYAAADTKGHATALLKALANRLQLDTPVNIHFTGCAHSCAQHYCGDLGFIATKLADGTEGYHLVVGGGMDDERGAGRELFRGLGAAEVTPTVEKILRRFQAVRQAGETFVQWTRRHTLKELQEILST